MFVAQPRLRRVAAILPPGGSAASAAAAVRATLARLDWRCPGLDDEAILCARRLTARARRRSVFAAADPRPCAELQQDVAAGLERLRREAFRPAHEFVPGNATAVLFANRAELLACFALDSLHGDQRHRWWWSVLPTDGGSIRDPEIWVREACLLPAIVQYLEARSAAREWLERLPAVFIARLWQALVSAFALESIAEHWTLTEAIASPDRARAFAPPRAPDAPPWQPWVPNAAGLTGPAQRVLVAALMLQRAPAILRSPAFQVALRKWTAPAAAPPSHAKAPPSESPVDGPADPPAALGERSLPLSSPTGPGEDDAPRRPTAPIEAALTKTSLASPPSLSGASPAPMLAPLASAAALRPTGTESAAAALEPASTATPLTAGIVSGWGGIFYLVNVALALELYGDFTSPARPGLALPVWDFLALCGRRLVGERFLSDPVDPLLGRLSARPEHEAPGAHFAPPDGLSLDQWLARLERQIYRRLADALGEPDHAALNTLVFEREARIRVGPTHVAVAFRLADHPLPLRLAGLDRDPGWVPAAGRLIAFHYD